MDFFEEYVNYLKDNPKGYWFKRKLYGWGWVPAKLEGWAVMGGYLAFVFTLIFVVSPRINEAAALTSILVPIVAATLLLIVIAWKKGESPKWQWGKHRD